VAAVTCGEVRDLFSARADDALTAEERARLDAHLATCGDCGREWRRFQATVGLLRAVEPARAPAGFVDRVLAARPLPWPRRLARALLVPWPVKLPLEAAAVVLVAGLAIMVFQRSPDLQHAARAPEAPVAVGVPDTPGPASTGLADRSSPPPPERARDVAGTRSRDLLEDAPAEQKVRTPPAASTRADEAARAEAERAGAAQGAPAPPPAAPEPAGEAYGDARARQAPLAALGRQGERDAGQPAAPTVTAPSSRQKAAKVEGLTSQMEARAAPADIEARLATPDRAATEREIRALVARLGGVVTSSPESVEVVVPRAAWDELARELARLGTLHVDRRPAELPPAVRVRLRVGD
jgi:hypothetical protein